MDRNSFYDNLANYSKNSLHSNGINLHDSSKIDFYNSLQHHGIKGQKWGVRRYQNSDGSLTEEGKQRYLNPDGSLNRQGQKELGREGVAKFNQQRQQQRNNNSGNVYDEETQKTKLNNAKQNKMYDKLFVETIQNADLSDDEINKEYESYLKDPKKYSETFETDSLGRIKNSLSGNNTSKAEKQASKFTQDEIKELLGDETPNKELKERAKSAFGPKATPEEESAFWKALAKEYEKGNIKSAPNNKTNNSKKEKESNKLTKEEKKEIKDAKKEAWKTATKKHGLRNLVTGPLLGTLSDWGMVNKAIKELGYTSEEKKNLTASDWNKINEKIADMRGFNK